MRKLALVAILALACSGCTFLKDSGMALCEAETKVSESIMKGANQIGFLGAAPLIGELLTTGLELFCSVLNEGLSVPADLSDAVGITTPVPEVETPEDGSN